MSTSQVSRYVVGRSVIRDGTVWVDLLMQHQHILKRRLLTGSDIDCDVLGDELGSTANLLIQSGLLSRLTWLISIR